ncbi:MAG: hypothetical protein ACTSRS_10675 [Candidatus Helarchaeota archaeon]
MTNLPHNEAEEIVYETPSEYEMWYEQGLTYYNQNLWKKAYWSFQQAETVIYKNLVEIFTKQNRKDSAHEYLRRVQKVANRPFRLAPSGSHWIRNFFGTTGIIALICGFLILISFYIPSSPYIFIISLIVLLFDLCVVLILFPLALVKGITRRKKSWGELNFKINYVQKQITAAQNNPTLAGFKKFLQIEKLKAKRARLACEMARYAYTESVIRSTS